MPDASEPPRAEVCVFSPTPLLTVTLEEEPDSADQLHLHVGGQGVWVARMVHRLGLHAVLCCAFGGETGAVARFLAEQEGLDLRTVDSAGWNGAYVHDRRDGERLELIDVPPAALSRHELDDLYSITVGTAMQLGTCVVTGAHNSNAISNDVFFRLVKDLTAADVRVVADLSGEPLAAVLPGGPAVIKVSDEELAADGWSEDSSPAGVLAGIRSLQDAGAHDVVVSRRDEPTIAVIDGRAYEVQAPSVEVVDGRGGGDAMTASLAVGVARGLAAEEALRLAAAAGAASVTRRGLATGAPELIYALAERITITPLDG